MIDDIYFNRDSLSAIEKSKRYSNNICALWTEIQSLKDKVENLQNLLDKTNNTEAVLTIEKIVQLLSEDGHIPNNSPGG